MKPVFVVGCPRSGTTLLQRMLDAHPAVAIAGETHFVGRFWARRDTYGDLDDDARYEQLVRDITSMPEFGEMDLNADEYQRRALGIKRSCGSLFRLLLELFQQRRGARVVGEKTPDHLVYAPVIAEFFPAARFIHIVRDPRAVVNSMRRVPWASRSVFHNAETWYKYMRYARRFPEALQRSFLTISYEALVRNPEDQLRSICRFLDLEFDPAMLSFHELETKGVSVAREPWKLNATKPLDPARLDGWRAELSSGMIAAIEGTVWRQMKQRGYQPLTGPVRLLPAAASAAVRRFANRAGRRASVMLGGRQDHE